MAYSEFYSTVVSRNLKEKGQAGSALTGTVAALLAADGVVWSLRYPETTVMPSASSLAGRRLYVQRIAVTAVIGTAFTTPVTLGRHLKLVRGAPTSGTAANPSGGAAYVMVRKRSDLGTDAEVLGVGRVATTAALTTTGLTFETAVIRRLPMSGSGASGSIITATWSFDGVDADPIYLLPGQLVALAAGATMDAAGTFELTVDVDAVEVP